MSQFPTLIVAAAVSLLAACGSSSTTNSTVANTTNTNGVVPAASASPVDTIAVGRKLYMSNCAACHKENGKGGKMVIEGKSLRPEDLTSAKMRSFPDEKIYGYIFNGIEDEGMPAFNDKMSEAEIREVVRYIRSELQTGL